MPLLQNAWNVSTVEAFLARWFRPLLLNLFYGFGGDLNSLTLRRRWDYLL